jgi:hypothetical protein
MTAWNSTEDILADVDRRGNKHAPQAARVGRPPMLGRSAKALASAKKTKRQVPTARGRKRQVGPIDYAPEASQDDVEDVEIVESQLAPMVPIPEFVAATLMEGYKSDPIELCWQTIEEILRKRASTDENAADALRLGEVASYVPRWLFSTAVNVRLAANSSTPFVVSNRSVRHLRMDEWTQGVHRRHLAVRARSILGGDAATRFGRGTEDVIRNLSSILERQVATGGASHQPERSPVDSFPPTTRQLVLFASEPMPDGTAPTRPITTFVEVLELSNVAFMQNRGCAQPFVREHSRQERRTVQALSACSAAAPRQ